MFLEFVIVVVLSWLLSAYFDQKRKAINLPGPKGVPISGQLFNLEKKFHMFNYKITEKYGKAVFFNIMKENFVLLGDAKLAKEFFGMDNVSGRPVFDFFLLFQGEALGVVNSEGHLWESHRRFTLRQLRDFGFGKNTMETLIMDEVHEFVDNLKKLNGAPVGRIKERFSLAVVNSLWKVISNKRFKHDDSDLQLLTKNLNRILTASAESGGLLFFMPWTRHVFPKQVGYTETRESFEKLKSFVTQAVEEHKKTFQPDYCRDFIDVFLKEMQTETDPSSTFYGKAAEKQLIAICADIFFAGNDTSSTTLSWGMLYLAMFPEVQYKLYKELLSITGGTRDIELHDRPNASYLLAVIDEILRLSSIVPTGVTHAVTKDFTHNGVLYKKGTRVDMNIYYIHRNPETWGDPDNFRPERFLTGEGGTYKKNENVISFSVGRRQCLGETLARDTLMLFLANIVQNFEILVESDKPKPSLEPALGFLLMPQEYQVMFKPRN